MSTVVGTKITAPGFHRWPGARGVRAYLAERHRHLFHLEANVHVAHDERDVEFHDLQDLIRDWWGPRARECGAASCEQLARELAAHLTSAGVRVRDITVAEDGESWATYTPKDNS